MRKDYIKSLLELKKKYSEIVVLDADCSNSTMTKEFSKKYYDSFYNIGIAEQNMVGIAAGLALCGSIPIVNSFGKMITMRSLEQINDAVAMPKLKIILVGHYAGLSSSLEGITHQAINDVALIRSIPNINVYAPSNAEEIKSSLSDALLYDGPSYIRLSKNEPSNKKNNYTEENNGYSFFDNGNDLIIVSSGSAIEIALDVINDLEKKDIKCSHLSLYKLKPLNEQILKKHMENKKLIVTIEEHSTIGGIGSIISEVLFNERSGIKLLKFGINDRFMDTGEYDYLIKLANLDKDYIVKYILDNLKVFNLLV